MPSKFLKTSAHKEFNKKIKHKQSNGMNMASGGGGGGG